MKILTIALFLVSTSAFALDCQTVGERQYKEISDKLVEDGKGIVEINQILRARLMACKGQCASNFGVCMAVVESK